MEVEDNNSNQLVPFLKWAGGKRWLLKKKQQIAPDDFHRYIEPFVGGGAVFFSLPQVPFILSDLNSELINCYRVLHLNWKSVQRALVRHQQNHSDEYYYSVRDSAPATNIQRAAKFLYLNRTCYNGLYRVNLAGKFNVPRGTKNKVILDTDNFKATSERLSHGSIFCQDFETTLAMAEADDFVFVDPPYTVAHNHNAFVKYNEKIFSWADQERLQKSILSAASRGAKITMTNADHDSIHQLYNGSCEIEQISRNSVISGDAGFRGKTNELLLKFGW